ncbi:MAG TPA: hemolysin III family protein, partial [Chloroflexota bacterium]|nr:hemolysin III family protein [Chloroflexota bacterium]
MTNNPPAIRRPVLRGWLHALAIGPAVIGTTILVGAAPGDSVKQLSLLIYGATLIWLFTVSAVYHVGTWSTERRATIRRLDNANIFVMIAGTYTPIVVTILSDFARVAMLAAIWTLALAGVVVVVRRISMRHGILIGLYLALGWLAVFVLPLLEQRVGWGGIATLAAGGVFFSLGAVAYGLKRPRLWPAVFSYHELFHLLVLAASASFYLFM